MHFTYETLIRVIEAVALAVVSTDPLTALRFALLASELRREVLR